ncbi:hypothetical protein [Qipengyuania sediminis]|uniref:hypothetical protein n=1 Tax=Qipengyuania sediminis TaxID=1532023 RepID=UPI00105A2D2B|nr:hypothetical protein [Qipengyuania sediminis]
MPIKLFAAPAMLAAAALVATPVAAAPLPVRGPAPGDTASHYGPSIGIGWGGGWGRGHGWRHRHRDRTGAGDVLAGVLILGTIAAVASAAARANERRGYPYPERGRPFDSRSGYRERAGRGLEGAADLCLREIERNARVREVTRVERDAGGWLVTGSMSDGAGFTCEIGADGRITDIDVGGPSASRDGPDDQYADDRYEAARAAAEAGTPPSYPGGPLPGEAPDD